MYGRALAGRYLGSSCYELDLELLRTQTSLPAAGLWGRTLSGKVRIRRETLGPLFINDQVVEEYAPEASGDPNTFAAVRESLSGRVLLDDAFATFLSLHPYLLPMTLRDRTIVFFGGVRQRAQCEEIVPCLDCRGGHSLSVTSHIEDAWTRKHTALFLGKKAA